MVKKALLALFLVLSQFIFSEVDLDASLNGAFTATRIDDEDLTTSTIASGSFTIKSVGLTDVKSQLTLDFTSVRDMQLITISKAWIKFRYPLFRVTIGKNRITWGEGSAFNAGDVIFDDYISPSGVEDSVDLTADELKSLNRTLAQFIFPLGSFTYAEAIYLPYDFFSLTDIAALSSGEEAENQDFNSNSYGGRFVTKLLGMKFETGYIFNGELESHKPYISLNGTLLLDYHFSSSINIIHGDTDFDLWKESLKISSGCFYIFDLLNDRTLTLRLESMVKPFGDWDSDALQLYPEISLVPNEELAIFLRAIINPIEFNFNGTLGINWKTYQGFSIGSFIGTEVNNDDTEISFSTVVTHKF